MNSYNCKEQGHALGKGDVKCRYCGASVAHRIVAKLLSELQLTEKS